MIAALKTIKRNSYYDSVLKNNPWTYKIKDINTEKIIGSFDEKELLLKKL